MFVLVNRYSLSFVNKYPNSASITFSTTTFVLSLSNYNTLETISVTSPII